MTFGLVCIVLAVVTGVVTELLPVKSQYRPLIPKALGLLAVVIGVERYGVSYEEAIGLFGSSLASASVAGMVKFTMGLREPLRHLHKKLWD